MTEIHEFILEQENFSAFDTVADALNELDFLVPGVRVYIISEDRFYYYKNDVDEFVPEAQSMGADDQTAAEVPYDNSSSGLTATNVQAAIDEVSAQQKAGVEVAGNFACDPADIVSRFPDVNDRQSNGVLFHNNSVDSRKQRMTYAVSLIYNRLQEDDANEIIDDIRNVSELHDNYVDFGREGTVEGDPEGLFDYIEAREGTSYEGTGLASKSYIPLVGSLQDVVNETMDILKYGKY